jgi:hypothetical protein
MTAIEVLVAASLTAMLLASVFSVLATIERQRVFLYSQADLPVSQLLVEDLRADFTSSLYLTVSPQRIAFEGFGAGQDGSGSRLHEYAEIVYELKVIGEKVWLLRSEKLSDDLNADVRRELVMHGIVSFDLLVIDNSSKRWESMIWSKTVNKRANAPDMVRIVGYGRGEKDKDEAVVLLDEVLIRHGVRS